jgi:dihydropteroate synthase
MRPETDLEERSTGTGEKDLSGPLSFGDTWRVGDRDVDLTAPLVMGILNVTPDSFSDGAELGSLEAVLARAQEMVEAGAGMLDLGGESTRPGAAPVPAEEEMSRVVEAVEAVSGRLSVPVSVDTRNAATAADALVAGASVVNDVSGLNHDPRMAGVVADRQASLVLSHMRGTPANMREHATYRDLGGEVCQELWDSLRRATNAGVEPSRIVVDPGIGFAKTGRQSLQLLGDLEPLRELGRPVLVGPSRKSFIGELTGAPLSERVPGTVAACVVAYLGGARVFRVHDVGPVAQALAVAKGILDARSDPAG